MSDEVVEATLEDVNKAVENVLHDIEMSAEELIEEYHANDFSSLRARVAWVVIGDILLEREKEGTL